MYKFRNSTADMHVVMLLHVMLVSCSQNCFIEKSFQQQENLVHIDVMGRHDLGNKKENSNYFLMHNIYLAHKKFDLQVFI